MIRVILLIRQLNLGGAQRQLLALALGLDPNRYEVEIVTFYRGGHYTKDLAGLPQVRLHSLEKRGRWDLAGFLLRYLRLIRRLRPDVCYGFLGGANLLTLLAKLVCPGVRVVWSVRGARVESWRSNWAERLTFSLQSVFSHLPNQIIANSLAGRDNVIAHGFPPARVLVVDNGIDTDLFRPDPMSRKKFRMNLGKKGDKFLIGMVSRPDPVKGQEIFLRAAAKVQQRLPQVHFLFVGMEESLFAARLKTLAGELGLADACDWMAAQREMVPCYNGLDLLVSASLSEGFPNVIAEAMACGLPCVVTDVGESSRIVGETGWVVPAGDPEKLAAALIAAQLMIVAGKVDSHAVRQRIVDRFSIPVMVRATEEALCKF